MAGQDSIRNPQSRLGTLLPDAIAICKTNLF